MRIVLTILSVLTTVWTAHAYESDSHLRVSYVLARAAGLSDAVAKYLSIGNQYIDETAMTSAMLLSSQRQLYHFHGDAAKVETSSHGGVGIIARMFKAKLALAERNHALGSVFLYHGLVQGDLQLFSAGTHTKMDTFGHAGFSNMLGHAPDGHSPDRAFLEAKKYEDMIREMLSSYVALRDVLPADYLDDKGAIDYLNKHVDNTYIQRKLTAQDFKQNNVDLATMISTIVLVDTDLQSIYRENIYKKYEYKKLALERIYDTFLKQGKINADVSFDDLFSQELIRNPSFDTTQVIMQTLIKNAHSEFLKTMSGKDIFNLSKLIEGQTEESFLRRYNMEVTRYEARLRQLDFTERHIQKLTGQARKSMEEKLAQEQLKLLSGLGDSAGADIMSEDFIKARAKELAQLKLADEMANHLTKDFIPREKTDYIKHQFEGEYDNRSFEKYYKDEAYRRFIHKNFGVNWVMGGGSKFAKLVAAMQNFKSIIMFKQQTDPKTVEVVERWKELAEKAAESLLPDSEMSSRDKAQMVSFNLKSKALWMVKHLKYVLQATPLVYGYVYMKKLSAEAKKFAHDHMSEDMKKAIEAGKYKANIIEKTTSAYQNVQQLKSGTRYRCSYLMRLAN
ncbi:MAG: hypothetical protein ABL930_11755 [Pseudobdellovibrio sp.]